MGLVIQKREGEVLAAGSFHFMDESCVVRGIWDEISYLAKCAHWGLHSVA